MPILNNPLSAATLLFGGEVEPVSFIEITPLAVDFGMSVKFSRTLFDLDLGAIQARLSVGLEGAVGVTLQVGIRYSSHGLTSGDPINGRYLVDAYNGNRALPMVALGGRVSVRVDGRFAVVGIAEAVFSGSGYVRLEGGLDLFDEWLVIPEGGRGNGMFHVDEILRVVDVAPHRSDEGPDRQRVLHLPPDRRAAGGARLQRLGQAARHRGLERLVRRGLRPRRRTVVLPVRRARRAARRARRRARRRPDCPGAAGRQGRHR